MLDEYVVWTSSSYSSDQALQSHLLFQFFHDAEKARPAFGVSVAIVR